MRTSHPVQEVSLMRLRFLVLFALTLAANLVAAGSALASGDASDPGWQALWGNDAAAAESAFRARLKTDYQDLDAQRGLILSLFCRGQERTIIKEIEALSRMKGAD